MAGALGGYTALAHLALGGNKIGAEGTGRLAEALKACTALHNELGKAGAGRLAGVLEEWRMLTRLELGWIKIGGEGAKRLGRKARWGSCRAGRP
eukprot:3937094-Rhodomonas_salina.2